MIYSSEEDPACYPGTDVLRNKQGLHRQADLDEFETAMFLIRSEELLPTGNFDVNHYLALHHHLFQDVYEWAGQIRKIRIGKGGNWFCYPENIENQLNLLFRKLVLSQRLEGLTRQVFVSKDVFS